MKLGAGSQIGEFAELRMKPGTWATHGIPERGCWIRANKLEEMLAGGGGYDPDELIYGLMDWLGVTDDPLPAIATLSRMLDRHYPPDGRTHATCHFADEAGGDRRFLIGAVDRSGALVTWQRDNLVFALGQASTAEPGRIVIAAPRPLPLNAALRILALGMQTFMLEPFDSFQGAITMSGATGNFYAFHRGELTTCYWPHGLGIREQHGLVVDCSDEIYPLLPPAGWLAPNQIAMLVGIAAGYAKW